MRTALPWIAGITLSCVGCTTGLPAEGGVSEKSHPLVIGRIAAVITGELARKYEPQVRSFEIEAVQSRERFKVEINSEDRHFAIRLPPGDYQLYRVQISEGPFMSLAEMNALFSVKQDSVTYVGTWRFGVESPGYGRMLALSIVMDAEDRTRAQSFMEQQDPTLEGMPLTPVLPAPPTLETRLYEVMPYPRYPSYFRRHNW